MIRTAMVWLSLAAWPVMAHAEDALDLVFLTFSPGPVSDDAALESAAAFEGRASRDATRPSNAAPPGDERPLRYYYDYGAPAVTGTGAGAGPTGQARLTPMPPPPNRCTHP